MGTISLSITIIRPTFSQSLTFSSNANYLVCAIGSHVVFVTLSLGYGTSVTHQKSRSRSNFLLLERGYFVKILLRIKQSQKRLNAKQNTVIFVRRDTYKFPSFNISQRNNIMVDSKDRWKKPIIGNRSKIRIHKKRKKLRQSSHL